MIIKTDPANVHGPVDLFLLGLIITVVGVERLARGCMIGISLCIISNASAANELDMQAPTLEDYEEVLEKLTKEFGVEFYISPENSKTNIETIPTIYKPRF